MLQGASAAASIAALPLAPLCLSLLFALAVSLAAASAVAGTPREALSSLPAAPGERALAARLLAPCCYAQTLDLHESETASDLRMEIRRRLYDGESVEAVERSIVSHYGERVRAAPARDPVRFVALGLLAVSALAGLLVLRVLRRWRATTDARPGPAAAALRDAYDERIDAELRDLE